MFWTIVGALLFVFVVLPLLIPAAVGLLHFRIIRWTAAVGAVLWMIAQVLS